MQKPKAHGRQGTLSAIPWICSSCLRNGQRHYNTSGRIWQVRALTRPTQTGQNASDVLRRPASTSTTAPRLNRNPRLPPSPARTRFAPSPTGHLHIGGLRTALFSYLLAKRTQGQFLLRIEDTDQKRLVQGAEERLLEDLNWAGLQWDEGPQVGGPFGPYKQSERNDIYRRHARALLDTGAAYRCFCTPQQQSGRYVTSGCYQQCSTLSKEEAEDRALGQNQPFTVRLQPPVRDGKRTYPDLIYGKIVPLKRSPSASIALDDDASSLDAADTILVKSDGTPTYHFANVVDDHLMHVTHVIRGSEWMASTPLHYDLYSAFGWQPPLFAHVGLLIDENKAKLSKRNSADMALDVRSMREEQGVLPQTLANFLALLGWSNPTRDDVLDLKELIEIFDLKFTKGNTMVKFDKLWYLQKAHVSRRCELFRSSGDSAFLEPMLDAVCTEALTKVPSRREQLASMDALRDMCAALLLVDCKNYKNAAQFVERNRYFFAEVSAASSVRTSNDDGSGTTILVDGKDWIATAADIHKMLVRFMEQPDTRLLFAKRDDKTVLLEPIVGSSIAPAGSMWFDSLGAELSGLLQHSSDAMFLAFEGADTQELSDKSVGESKRKALRVAVMRVLREKLSGGLPGPSIGIVMALLGYEECCQRLGVRTIVDGPS